MTAAYSEHLASLNALARDIVERCGQSPNDAALVVDVALMLRANPLIDAAAHSYAACKTVKAFLVGLEGNSDMDRALAVIRARVHAPLHEALDAAIEKVESTPESKMRKNPWYMKGFPG